jgi:Protein of unknown function (DUF2959)
MVFLAAGAVGLFGGCGTPSGYQQADKTGENITAFRDELVKGTVAIDATLKSLGQIAATANSDPRPAFTQYSKDISNLESAAQKVRSRAQTMRESGDAYFKQWEAEAASVKNPEIRDVAEKRKAKLQEAFKKINARTEPLKAQYEPWMSNLKDLQKLLHNDLTVEGVGAAGSLIGKSANEGAEVHKSIDALVAELNTIAATLTAAKVPPKP